MNNAKIQRDPGRILFPHRRGCSAPILIGQCGLTWKQIEISAMLWLRIIRRPTASVSASCRQEHFCLATEVYFICLEYDVLTVSRLCDGPCSSLEMRLLQHDASKRGPRRTLSMRCHTNSPHIDKGLRTERGQSGSTDDGTDERGPKDWTGRLRRIRGPFPKRWEGCGGNAAPKCPCLTAHIPIGRAVHDPGSVILILPFRCCLLSRWIFSSLPSAKQASAAHPPRTTLSSRPAFAASLCPFLAELNHDWRLVDGKLNLV